jgi:hypothetical protein
MTSTFYKITCRFTICGKSTLPAHGNFLSFFTAVAAQVLLCFRGQLLILAEENLIILLRHQEA